MGNIGNASLTNEYRLFVSNALPENIDNTYTTVPVMISVSGADAWATTSSLNAYGYNWYSDVHDKFLGGHAGAELRVTPDTLTSFQVSFDYEIDSGGPGWANVSGGKKGTSIGILVYI
jgi:hypothetical protein